MRGQVIVRIMPNQVDMNIYARKKRPDHGELGQFLVVHVHKQRGADKAFLAFTHLLVLLYFFIKAANSLDAFGEGNLRMAEAYIKGAAEKTGSANLVTGVVFDFRGYDTLGEATVLVTAVLGVLTILRIKGKK